MEFRCVQDMCADLEKTGLHLIALNYEGIATCLQRFLLPLEKMYPS